MVPALIGYTVSTKAAFGEKVPAKPPDSFQAATTGLPAPGVTWMPMSWLYPALKVQRSALALSRTFSVAVGVMVKARLLSSITCQVVPSLLGSRYWLWLTAVRAALGATPDSGVTELDCAWLPAPTAFTAATPKYRGAPSVCPVTVVDVPLTGCGVPTWTRWSLYVVTV